MGFVIAALMVVFLGLQAFVAFYNFYQIAISAFGLRRHPERRGSPPSTRFVFIVAAYNEERVIAGLIESLFRQNYPRSYYDVWVVADNCTDGTATVARRAGAHVLERSNATERGKNHALRYAFDHLLAEDTAPDAVVIVDADNLVHPDFLALVNENFLRGDQVVQGYLGTKNPDDSNVSRLYYLTYTLANRNCQLARRNAGLVCALGGTGMCISTKLLRRIGWHPRSLTEDLEFSVQAYVEAGVRSIWNHEAIVYDEKPTGFLQSLRQRERWMRGHVSVMYRYIGYLLRHALIHRDFRSFDLALYLLSPFRMMLMGIPLVLALVGFIVTHGQRVPHFLLFNYQTWFSIFAFQVAYPLLYLALEKVPLRRLTSFMLLPFWSLTWAPLATSGLLRSRNTQWNHTQHQSTARIDDIV